MKKLISFVMAAAMVASLVPATAFASGKVDATFKVVDALTLSKDDATANKYIVDNHSGNADADRYDRKVPELRATITSADYRVTKLDDLKAEFTLTLDNANFLQMTETALKSLVTVYEDSTGNYLRGDDSSLSAPAISNGNAAGFTEGAGTDYAVKENGEWVLKAQAADYSAITDNEDALTYLLGKGRTFTIGACATGKNMSMTNGTDTVIVVEGGTTPAYKTGTVPASLGGGDWSDAKVAAALAAGWTFASAADPIVAADIKVNDAAPGASANNVAVQSATVPAATQVAFDAQDNGWVQGTWGASTATTVTNGLLVELKKINDDSVTFVITRQFAKDDYISFDLESVLDKTGEGRTATVTVESDFGNADDLVYVSIGGREISASTKKQASVAEEEMTTLEKDLVIKSKVGDFVANQWFELKLSKGFEFTNKTKENAKANYEFGYIDDNVAYVQFKPAAGDDMDELTIAKDDIEIEAVSAKSGAVCTMTVKALDDLNVSSTDGTRSGHLEGAFDASATVELMKVVDYKVILTKDEDEDLPVIYSGVDVDNYGITDDSDHLSVEVTAEETFPGAWSFRKGFNFELPEGVYVTDVKVIETDGLLRTTTTAQKDADDVDTGEVFKAFFDAYQDGSHVNFEFKKRVFDDVDSVLNKDKATMTFQLELVADPGFEGDVVLKLTGELVDDQEITIAKFVKPYEVKAEQNDMIIDYRYTDVPTAISITEAEKGLWAKNEARFDFKIEKSMEFEGDPTFEIDSKSGMEIKNDKADGGAVTFMVKTESDEAATVTIKDMQLFMERNIPAGPYKLKIASSLAEHYDAQALFAQDHDTCDNDGNVTNNTCTWNTNHEDSDKDCYVGEVADYSTTVKEAFINVVTAGRDQDDASFTTKVVVPVGENYIVAGEKQIELDTPAYINAAGYTMLPIRAVAVALGINSNNVLWDQPTKTVTILYGQRIITMTQGQKVVYVNGSAIPASAAVENTNSRTFLPMRDLATALGVTDITWDQATRTATLNGNQK